MKQLILYTLLCTQHPPVCRSAVLPSALSPSFGELALKAERLRKPSP